MASFYTRCVTLRRAHEVRIRRLANQALVDVFNSLGGIRWSNRSGWLTPGTEVKTWHGLTVDAGKLISLNLISNDLEVCIPIYPITGNVLGPKITGDPKIPLRKPVQQ